MRSEIEIDSGRPEELKEIVELSLDSTEKVTYNLKTEDKKLIITTETDGLGPLRGCTDTIFRLTSLAKKLY